MNWQPTEGEQAPPLSLEDEQEAEVEQAEEVIREANAARQGKVPLHPAAIRFPVSVSGNILSELTGFDGWRFTDRELEDLVEIWSQLNIQVSPVSQAVVATTTVFTLKASGYIAWMRAGKPAPEARNRSEAASDR